MSKSASSNASVSGPPSTVTTRRYEAADLRALYAIEETCFEPSVRFSRTLMRSLANNPNCRIWLGILDNIRVGFAIVGLSDDDDPTSAYIWTIEVLPAFRRMGIARQLLRSVENSAVEANCSAITLHVSERNPNAVSLYEAAGYTLFGTEPEFYGRGENAFRYRKQLGL